MVFRRAVIHAGYIITLSLSAVRRVLVPLLQQLPDQEFRVYGFNKQENHGNVQLCAFSEAGFIADLASARAIVTNPDLILADESTGNLDSARSVEIMELLVRLNQERGMTIVMVTHEPDMASFARRIVHFKDGLIASDELSKP